MTGRVAAVPKAHSPNPTVSMGTLMRGHVNYCEL